MTEIYDEDRALMLLETEQKRSEGFKYHPLDHNAILISSEIEMQIETSGAFDKLLATALTEISEFMKKEKVLNYLIDVNIMTDYEYTDWRDVVIVKVPIQNPEYVVDMWYRP